MYESNEIRYGRKMSRYQHYLYSVSVSPNTFYGTIEIDISYDVAESPPAIHYLFLLHNVANTPYSIPRFVITAIR